MEPAGANLKMQIQLIVQCRNLRDLDYVGKSDPTCQVLMRNENEIEWRDLGFTEIKKDDLNPDFEKFFRIDYYFEKKVPRFIIYTPAIDSVRSL